MSKTTLKARYQMPKKVLAEFCRRHRVKSLALFGSVLRDDFTKDSDVDVLVEFEPDAGVGFFELFDMEEELSIYFEGHTVEINTPNSLSRFFRDEVLKEAEVIYDKT
jgi:predicted nucleotidyltransferase